MIENIDFSCKIEKIQNPKTIIPFFVQNALEIVENEPVY